MRFSLAALLTAILVVAMCLAAYRQLTRATIVSHPPKFDGLNDVVEVPDRSSLDLDDAFTIEVRLKIPRRQSSRLHTSCIVGKGKGVNNTDHNYYLGVLNRNNKLYFHIGDSTGGYQQLVSAEPLTPERWIRVAAVRDSNRLALYIDGKLDAETPRQIQQEVNDQPLRIGATEGTLANHYFGGEIDEVRIWKVARSMGQLEQSFNHKVDPSADSLVFVSERNEDADPK